MAVLFVLLWVLGILWFIMLNIIDSLLILICGCISQTVSLSLCILFLWEFFFFLWGWLRCHALVVLVLKCPYFHSILKVTFGKYKDGLVVKSMSWLCLAVQFIAPSSCNSKPPVTPSSGGQRPSSVFCKYLFHVHIPHLQHI